ncbi:MAG TPA: hypothetical protein ENN72_02115 [Firmicutes bacterium]|nr:hypothetical protein [Bacillota bacterium]
MKVHIIGCYCVIILAFTLIFSGCARTAVSRIYGDKREISEDEFSVLKDVFRLRVNNIVFNDEKAYCALDMTPSFGERGIFYLPQNLQAEMKVSVPDGRGPGEAMAMRHLVIANGYFYLFDLDLVRFLKYDESLNYLDTINMDQGIRINTFVMLNNELTAIVTDNDSIAFYTVIFNETVALKEKYRFPLSNTVKELSDQLFRVFLSSVLLNSDELLVVSAFDIVLYFQKKPCLEKTHELKLEIKKGKDGSIRAPFYVRVMQDGSFIYDYFEKRYRYDYPKKRLIKMKQDETLLEYDLYGKSFRVIKEEDRYYIQECVGIK